MFVAIESNRGRTDEMLYGYIMHWILTVKGEKKLYISIF